MGIETPGVGGTVIHKELSSTRNCLHKELSSRAERGIFSAGSDLRREPLASRARSLVAGAPRDDSFAMTAPRGQLRPDKIVARPTGRHCRVLTTSPWSGNLPP